MCWSSSDRDFRWVCISTDVFSPRIRGKWCSRLPGTERLSAGETAHGLEPSCTEQNRASWHKWKRPRPLDPNAGSCCRAERRTRRRTAQHRQEGDTFKPVTWIKMAVGATGWWAASPRMLQVLQVLQVLMKTWSRADDVINNNDVKFKLKSRKCVSPSLMKLCQEVTKVTMKWCLSYKET